MSLRLLIAAAVLAPLGVLPELEVRPVVESFDERRLGLAIGVDPDFFPGPSDLRGLRGPGSGSQGQTRSDPDLLALFGSGLSASLLSPTAEGPRGSHPALGQGQRSGLRDIPPPLLP